MIVRAMLVLTLIARTAHAGECDPAEVSALREHLAAESGKAETWNTAWRWIFTASAVGTAVAGAIDPVPSANLKYGFYGSAGKAAVAALARWVIPLRIHIPDATGDACVDTAALRKEVRRVARKERGLFWMGHLGGVLVNLGGAAYVYYYDGFGKAALSVAIGYPIGLISNYTMPRGTWKLAREREAAWRVTTVGVQPTRDSAGGTAWLFGIGGEL